MRAAGTHREQPVTAETSSRESGAEHAEKSHGEAGVTILGVDTESLALSVLAAWLFPRRGNASGLAIAGPLN